MVPLLNTKGCYSIQRQGLNPLSDVILNLFDRYVEPILLYGYEAWAMNILIYCRQCILNYANSCLACPKNHGGNSSFYPCFRAYTYG